MEDTRKKIDDKLRLIGVDPEHLKPFIKKHIEKIEIYLTTLSDKNDLALEVLQSKKHTASAIAKELAMSRTTLYNHEGLLKRYIDISAKELLEKNPVWQLAQQKQVIDNLQVAIDKLEDRDVTIEIQKHEYNKLLNKLNDKQQEIIRLEKRNRELSKQLIDFKKLQPNKTNVINLNSKES